MEIGQVFSAFMLGYALCQYPSGALNDRFGTRRVLGGALLAWGVLTVATALVETRPVAALLGNFGALLGIRFLLGVAEAPTYPGSSRVVSTWVPPEKQAKATSIFSIGMASGSAVAPPLVAWLMLSWGWKAALYVLSIPAFLLAALWATKGGDGPGRDSAISAASSSPPNAVFWNKNAWLLTTSYFLNNYAFYVFVFWFFPYLVQVRHFDIIEGSWIATAPWVLTIVLAPLGGSVSDSLVRSFGETWGRRILPLLSMPAAALLLFLGAREQNPYLAVAALTLCEGLIMFSDPVFWAAAIRIAPQSAGRSSGLMNMGGNLGGFVSASLTPWLASRIGWIGSLHFTAALTVLGGLLWFWIPPQKGWTSHGSGEVTGMGKNGSLDGLC